MISKLMFAALLSAGIVNAAQANVYITEWMYNGSEYIEFTNLGTSAVDFTGWSYDDESRIAGTVSLSDFGTLAVGKSAILAEDDAATFRTKWNLSASVKVIGGNTANLGRNDEINLYNAGGGLVDRLLYGDSSYVPGSIRTQNISGNPATLALLGQGDSTGWVLSSVGDSFGSVASTTGMVGNPGVFALAIPEPETYALMLAGLGVVGFMARRRK